jgi:hypothetical protein
VESKDRALHWIIAGNVLALVTVYLTNGGLLLLLWPYWAQSVVIGYYAQKRMRALKEFSTDGFKRNNRQVEATPAEAGRTANFFILHYGGFHAGYLVFLLAFTFGADAGGMAPIEVNGNDTEFYVGRIDWLDALFIVAIVFSFVQAQRIAHQEQVEADVGANRNLGGLMAFPYLRVIPMHLTIILGAMMSSAAGLVLFGGLKTLADVGMHAVERHWLKGR